MKLTESNKQSLRDGQAAHSRLAKLRGDLAALENSPELAQLELKKTETLASIRSETSQMDLATAEVNRLESDIEVVKKRIQRDQSLLQTMSNPKDISGVEHELGTLSERLDALENAELENLERIEQLERLLTQLESELNEVEGQIRELERERQRHAESLRVDIEAQQQDCSRALGELPEELVKTLEQLWARGSGVGELRDTTCGVCHMGLNSSAINEIKRTPLDEIAQCPECRAILLRAGGD